MYPEIHPLSPELIESQCFSMYVILPTAGFDCNDYIHVLESHMRPKNIGHTDSLPKLGFLLAYRTGKGSYK